MSQGKPPKKRSPRRQPESTAGKPPGMREAPAAAERTNGREPEPDKKLAPPQTTPAEKQPVTNQDEQERITNAGESDLPIADK